MARQTYDQLNPLAKRVVDGIRDAKVTKIDIRFSELTDEAIKDPQKFMRAVVTIEFPQTGHKPLSIWIKKPGKERRRKKLVQHFGAQLINVQAKTVKAEIDAFLQSVATQAVEAIDSYDTSSVQAKVIKAVKIRTAKKQRIINQDAKNNIKDAILKDLREGLVISEEDIIEIWQLAQVEFVNSR
jgi:hypothetical protein